MSEIVLDIETTSKMDHIWCCVTKDLSSGEVICHTEADTLKPVVKKATRVIGHNLIGFDGPKLKTLWGIGIPASKAYDTLTVSRLLDPQIEGGHSLNAWGKRLGDDKIDFTDYDGGLTDEMIDYCVQDVELTGQVYEHFQRIMEEHKSQKRNSTDWTQAVELEHQVQIVISGQERHGFKLDIPHANKLLIELSTRMNEIKTHMQELFPPIVTERYSEKTGKRLKDHVEEFNVGSRKQIAKRLETLGAKFTKVTEKGNPIVDESTLSEIDLPEAKLIAEYLMLQKRVAQVDSWINAVKDDGRVHGRVITNGAVTGRMTHLSPNMAQIPAKGKPFGEECRQCWTVDPGYKLVGADASGLELRMLAHYMGDPGYTKEVLEGDIHTANQKAAGLPTRNNAKTFIYAFLYGAGPAKIGSIVGGSAKEGQSLIASFLRNTPALSKLREKVDQSIDKGWLRGLDGRRIFIRSGHAALNSLLQGAGSIVMKQAQVNLAKSLREEKLDAKFCATVHDEWQIEVKEDQAERAGQLAVQAIVKAGEDLNLKCPLDGEYNVGNNWADTH
jgi:DNA polymerase I-like protein with 3'-5' exonuclease and polymerase domains